MATTVIPGAARGTILPPEVLARFLDLIADPNLRNARRLEDALVRAGYDTRVFGRQNQRASIEANSESDRGAAERLANAFDATLKAARIAMGLKSERRLNPRNAAQRFFCPNLNRSEWDPQDKRFEDLRLPVVEFWEEEAGATQRYRKFHPEDGLATMLVRDNGSGIDRAEMVDTILALNSPAKLREFEAIGQFGHGGSSSLFFCESTLIATQPRFEGNLQEVYWTLVFPEKDPSDSKQELIRKWFSDQDGLPLVFSTTELPAELRRAFPGTSVWHFGYHRGGWVKRIVYADQTNPWGRLGRLFFSYPLPFEIHGALARGDEGKYRRVKSPYHRLVEDAEKKKEVVQYFSPEKRERLLVADSTYGEFSFVAFVLPSSKEVGNYVDRKHPVVLTLNGQNHGELTRTVLENANLPELSASMIVEVRLDGLEQEALGHIIQNSREMPKPSPFTRALVQRLEELLREDETLQQLERERQERKAKDANQELNSALSKFIREILSDASGRATPISGGDGLGERRQPREGPPPISAADPPTMLGFVATSALKVPEGTTRLAKFKTDARPPKYAFGGDNPRLFAEWLPTSELGARVTIVGRAEVNDRGYGSISLHCAEDAAARISEVTSVGKLEIKLQSTDGNVLTAYAEVAVAPKPEKREKLRVPEIEVRLLFSAPGGDPDGGLAALYAENLVGDFGTPLTKFKDALSHLQPEECTYWAERHDREGRSVLAVEVNAANSKLKKLLAECRTTEERILAKARYCQDVVLDCYQHCFKLDQVPDPVWHSIQNEEDEARKASEFYLNHDKAVRFAARERERGRK